jgi:4-hydroxy-L-threonine phosphate dehydrogenase PdxA
MESKTDKFFKKCNEAHNQKYDYSKSEYKGTVHKILIICPIHKEFLQKAATHYSGHGCPKCAKLLYGNGKRL